MKNRRALLLLLIVASLLLTSLSNKPAFAQDSTPTPSVNGSQISNIPQSDDLLQIGNIFFSKTLLNVLAPLFGTLVGTLVGGAITYSVTRRLEILKWEREREEKYFDQVREALSMTLEWLNPLEASLSEISILISAYIDNGISFEELQKRFPDVTVRLGKLDPPRHLQVLLPDGVYSKSWDFIRMFQSLQVEISADHIFKTIQKHNRKEKMAYYYDYLGQMSDEVNEYKGFLATEYKKTFLLNNKHQ